MKVTMDVDINDRTVTTIIDDDNFSGDHFLLLLDKIMQDTILLLGEDSSSLDKAFEDACILIRNKLAKARLNIETSGKYKKFFNNHVIS